VEGLVYGLRHLQQYFSYIVAVGFIGGGNWSIRKKPPTCRKSLTTVSHNVVLRGKTVIVDYIIINYGLFTKFIWAS
jgi:hypothetical protein